MNYRGGGGGGGYPWGQQAYEKEQERLKQERLERE